MLASPTSPLRDLLLRIVPLRPDPPAGGPPLPGPDPARLNQQIASALGALLRSFREATVWVTRIIAEPESPEPPVNAPSEALPGSPGPPQPGAGLAAPAQTPPHLLPPPLLPTSPNVVWLLDHPVDLDRWRTGTETLIPAGSPPTWRDFAQEFHQDLVARLQLPDLGLHTSDRDDLAGYSGLVLLSRPAFASHLTYGSPLTQDRRAWPEAYHLLNAFVTAARRYPTPWKEQPSANVADMTPDPPGT